MSWRHTRPPSARYHTVLHKAPVETNTMPFPSMEVGSSSAPSDTSGSVVQVCFPGVQASVLDSLNRQREDGRLCDLSIHVQGQVFKAHRCVLAASSPYFHDQVLLKNMSTVSIPAVMDPLAFESVLSCAYTGQLCMLREDIVNYLTVGSVLQMWHIVDKCTELLKEGRAAAGGGGAGGGGGGVQDGANVRGGGVSASDGVAGGGDGAGGGQAQVEGSNEPQRAPQPPSRPSVSESQSPSSTNYFSPRDGSGFGGGGAAAAGASVDGGGASTTPRYCTRSGGEEAFLIEEEEEEDVEEDVEEEVLFHQRKRGRGVGGSSSSRRRKKMSSAPEQEVGVSDSFGVSSYQDGEDSALPLQKRPAYSQPSIMPRKQWVVVKTERAEDDDDLIVVSGGEEGGEDEEEEEDDEREMELARERERSDFNISNVRSLSADLGGRAESDMDSQVDYCQSSEDYLKFEGSLMEQTLAHLHDGAAGQSASRAASALLGQVQSAASARAQLFPLDMQGNQILLYSQALDAAAAAGPPPGMAGGVMGGAPFKGPGLEHGAVHLSAQGALGADGVDGGGAGGGGGAVGGAGGPGKVFMCHCGKTFTHKSMRDRHINMHLDLRPFHCPVCAKKFKMKHHLTEHMKTHTGLKPYDCLGCGKKFMWRDSFMRHRSHCERRGDGEGGRRGAGGEEGPDLIGSSHLLLSGGEGGHGGILRGGGGGGQEDEEEEDEEGGGMSSSSPHRSGGSSSRNISINMAAAGSQLGAVSQSAGQGSGMFGLGLGRGVCDEDVCEVGAEDGSVT
ncbi:zinc finger and BTB domain-containing protein 22b [Pungitius pungitius]|uniref:zinc finger and BTB domain-containing protein 22b n=1 Tax=Pungitius pungitius TaxID=134920 RepID=UPI002E128F62